MLTNSLGAENLMQSILKIVGECKSYVITYFFISNILFPRKFLKDIIHKGHLEISALASRHRHLGIDIGIRIQM